MMIGEAFGSLKRQISRRQVEILFEQREDSLGSGVGINGRW